MRTIIAGSRTITDKKAVYRILSKFIRWKITTVLCGDAQGVDSLGDAWARKYEIPVEHYPAKWKKYGLAAGPIRNRKMARSANFDLGWEITRFQKYEGRSSQT